MAKYLDQAGLAHFWDQINAKKLGKDQISFALDESKENLVLSVGENVEDKKSIPLSDLYDGVIDRAELVDGNILRITPTKGAAVEVDLSSLNVNDTTSTVTVSDSIQVTGTPLADIFNQCGVDKIDPGTNLQKLLEKLLYQVVWPEAITKTNPSASVALNDATSTNDKQIYEVGENVVTTASPATNPFSISKVDAKVANLTYGYAFDHGRELEKDTLGNILTSYTVLTEAAVVKGDGGVIDISYKNDIKVDTSTAGNKSFTVIQTPRNYTFTYSNAGITLYPANNLGKTQDPVTHEDKEQIIAGVSGSPNIDEVKSTTINYTVKYKYYIGTAATDPTTKDLLQSGETLKKLDGLSTTNAFLENSGTTTIVNEKAVVKTDGNSLYIAIPASYTISSIKSSLGADLLGTLSEPIVITYVTDNDYKLYKLPVIGGAVLQLKDIKITK